MIAIDSAWRMTQPDETAVAHATEGDYPGDDGAARMDTQGCSDDKFDRLLTAVSRGAAHRLVKELNQCNG